MRIGSSWQCIPLILTSGGSGAHSTVWVSKAGPDLAVAVFSCSPGDGLGRDGEPALLVQQDAVVKARKQRVTLHPVLPQRPRQRAPHPLARRSGAVRAAATFCAAIGLAGRLRSCRVATRSAVLLSRCAWCAAGRRRPESYGCQPGGEPVCCCSCWIVRRHGCWAERPLRCRIVAVLCWCRRRRRRLQLVDLGAPGEGSRQACGIGRRRIPLRVLAPRLEVVWPPCCGIDGLQPVRPAAWLRAARRAAAGCSHGFLPLWLQFLPRGWRRLLLHA